MLQIVGEGGEIVIPMYEALRAADKKYFQSCCTNCISN
jgi:hypothetical protein